MSREGDLMRRALKRQLFPALKALGFAGGPSYFRRTETDSLDLLTIQYWKYGGEFILEFARRPRGPLKTSWGKVVEEDKLDVAYVHPVDRARLVENMEREGPNLHGFEYAGFGDNENKYLELATNVSQLLSQVDNWLAKREIGPNVRPLSNVADA